MWLIEVVWKVLVTLFIRGGGRSWSGQGGLYFDKEYINPESPGTAMVHVNTWTFNINKANTNHEFISPHVRGQYPPLPIPGARISHESFVPMVTGFSNSLENCFKKVLGAKRALWRGEHSSSTLGEGQRKKKRMDEKTGRKTKGEK